MSERTFAVPEEKIERLLELADKLAVTCGKMADGLEAVVMAADTMFCALQKIAEEAQDCIERGDRSSLQWYVDRADKAREAYLVVRPQ